MLAVLLAVAAAISFGGSDYMAGRAARRVGVVKVAVTAEVIKAVLVMAVVPFVSSQAPTTPSLTWGLLPASAAALERWRCTWGSGMQRSAWLAR